MTEILIDQMFENAVKEQDIETIKDIVDDFELDVDGMRLGEDEEHPLLYLAKSVKTYGLPYQFVVEAVDALLVAEMDLLAQKDDDGPRLLAEVLALQTFPVKHNAYLMLRGLSDIRAPGTFVEGYTDPRVLIKEIVDIALDNNRGITPDQFNVYSPFAKIRAMLEELGKGLDSPDLDDDAYQDDAWNVETLIGIVEAHEEELCRIVQGLPEPSVQEGTQAGHTRSFDPAGQIIAKMKEKYVGQDGPIRQAQAMVMRDQFDKRRLSEEDARNAPKRSMHMRFEGAPGTLKTTMAREYGNLLHAMGRSNGTFVELTREKLVAKYLGQTEDNVKTLIEEAIGGTLFIDEVHNLIVNGNDDGEGGSRQDYGYRVVEALVGAMERHRDNLTVIVAGYSDDIERFIGADPGLRDRFALAVQFESYDEDALADIMDRHLQEHSLTMSDDVKKHAIDGVMQYKEKVGKRGFGNGRVIRNFAEGLPDHMATRVGNDPTMHDASPEKLNAVQIADVDAYVADLLSGVNNAKNRDSAYSGEPTIGFTAQLKHRP